MEYRSRGLFESTSWVAQNAVLWVGIIGIAWNVLKPGGWLYQLIAIVVDNQPTSFYYVGLALLGLLAGKHWLDQLNPNACFNLLSFGCACAGSFFILRLLLPL